METKERRRPTKQRPAEQRSAGQRQPTQRTAGQRQTTQRTTGQRQPAQRQASQNRTRTTAGSTATRSRTRATAQTARTSAPTRRRSSTPKPSPDVVYVQPTPFNRARFVLCLLIVVAVVLAVIFGMSLFFKVDADKIMVSGAEKYTAWQIREASGIKDGENLLSISEARISSNIEEALPYVNKVRVGIKLPDTVKIEIEELDVVYSVEAEDATWWLMRSDGVIVDKTNAAEAEQYTRLLGVKITKPAVGEKAVAAQPKAEETSEEGETAEKEEAVPQTANQAAEQLDAAISIFQYLEDRGIVGEAASVDVTNMTQLEVWYKDRFQIQLGDSTQLAYKIKLAQIAVDQYMQSYDSGVLDVSLTIQPDEEKEYQVIYTPFDQ